MYIYIYLFYTHIYTYIYIFIYPDNPSGWPILLNLDALWAVNCPMNGAVPYKTT